MPTALVTGSAGFIGYHLCQRLLNEGWAVTGFDALTDYYDVALKKRRHAMLSQNQNFTPVIGRLEEEDILVDLISRIQPDVIVHLAAQAGVRYSIDNPRSYVDSNLVGTFNLLEAARATGVDHLLLASTSSVYGANEKMPFAETDKADSQMSFYAATKKATEAMAHSYAHLYVIPTTMFRFFTVYGPWGRPDMAIFKFTDAILKGDTIDIYNHGKLSRDFTYIDDLIDGIVGLIDVVPKRPESSDSIAPGDSLSHVAPFRIVNIGNAAPTRLMDFIAAVETATGIIAKKNFMDMQPGDVYDTWANTDLAHHLSGNRPSTTLATGVAKFVEWYRDYYRV
ncbi:MAG: NAD-dependent epimerase/dehydratase family protein [Paracoccaceae bacterium]